MRPKRPAKSGCISQAPRITDEICRRTRELATGMYQGLPATDELAKRVVHGGIEPSLGSAVRCLARRESTSLRVLFLMILFASTYRMRPQRSPNGQ